MKFEKWEELKKENFEEYRKAYSDYMYSDGIAYDCLNCPEGNGKSRLKPCGQQVCWVTAHRRN